MPPQVQRLILNVGRRARINALLVVFLVCVMGVVAVYGQTFTVIHTFTGMGDGSQPRAGLILDGAGNLYGTTMSGGNGDGVVYRISKRGPSWVLSRLYAFPGYVGDGALPQAAVIRDAQGILYGTTSNGGLQTSAQRSR